MERTLEDLRPVQNWTRQILKAFLTLDTSTSIALPREAVGTLLGYF